MSGETQHHHHRSTLKQKNKAFKSRHASKGSLKQAAKGRQESTTSRASLQKASPLSSHNASGSGLARRNHAKQIQLQKRAALIRANRIFQNTSNGPAGLNGNNTGLGKGVTNSKSGGAPRIVAVCALTQDINSWDAIQEMEDEGEEGGVKPVFGKSFKEAFSNGQSFVELDLIRFKTTLQLHPIPYGALYPLLDVCKAADFVLLLLSSTSSIESGSWGELALRTLQAQGMPTVMAATPTFESAGQGSKKSKVVTEIRKSLLSFTQYFAPEVERVYSLEETSERSALLRGMATSTPRRVAWRDFRSWLVSEEAEWQCTSSQEADNSLGILKIKGWARGAPLSANRLVHIPDFGDFEVEKITLASSHRKFKKQECSQDVDMSEVEEEVLDEHNDELADDLISQNSVNDMENEQTWPTQEEMEEDHHKTNSAGHVNDLPPALPGTTPKSIFKNKSKGKDLRYDANWIKELSDFDEEDESDIEDALEVGTDALNTIDGVAADDKDDEVESDFEDDYDEEKEKRDLAEYKARMEIEKVRQKEELQNVEFPDEVDTPLEIPARIRFARYRGLKSFRTSPWDPYEDLPSDYARIFQFDDFKKTRRSVEASALEEGVGPGVQISIWIKNVPKEAAIRARASNITAGCIEPIEKRIPFIIFGLLRHEHKKSVLNFTVTRNTEYQDTVRSKDPLILCLGPRRYRVNPIFSQHDIGNNGKNGSNNVHKFERYLRGGMGVVSIATIFGSVTFGGSNVSAMLLKERKLDGESGHDQRGVGANQMPILVGTGSLLDADPTRIIAKRIILTGHPYKVHKKTSTIRFMFFNPEDVRYYSPLELKTKYGRVGHIQESLGTHGYFKAHFDGPPLSQIDTVSLSLYKRSYPKFSQLYQASQEEMPKLVEKGPMGNDIEMQ